MLGKTVRPSPRAQQNTMHICIVLVFANISYILFYLYNYFYLTYYKIVSSNTSCLEAHVGFFRLLMKGIFGPNVLWPFEKKLIF